MGSWVLVAENTLSNRKFANTYEIPTEMPVPSTGHTLHIHTYITTTTTVATATSTKTTNTSHCYDNYDDFS